MDGVIYMIRHVSSNKCYIGLTADYSRRKNEHLYDLRNNKHHNKHLQNYWNKYGEREFEFTILLQGLCSEKELKNAEIRLIEEYCTTNRYRGFNISKGGDTTKWVPINMYDKHGNFIASYDTIALAASALSKGSTPIWKALNKIIPTAHGYQWRYMDDIQDVRSSISDHSCKGATQQYTLDGIFVAEYANPMVAAKAILHTTNAKSYKSVAINIRKVCYGQMRQYMNFVWKLKS